MEAKAREALERFEHAQHHGGDHGDDGDAATSHLVRNAAITVAVLAAFLAVATLLATKAMTKVITGETKAADTNAALHANEVKTTFAEHDAQLLRVIGTGDSQERAAAERAAAIEQELVEHYGPIDSKLAAKAHAYEASRDDAEQKHKLYEYSTAGLQIAIVIASISIIARRRWLLRGAGGVGVASIGILVAGLLA